jgi:hypothetical protein
LAHAHEIKQPKRREALIENEAKARLSRELVKLDDEVPLPCPLSALRVKPIDLHRLLPFLREMEFRALSTRMTQQLTGPAAAAVAATAPAATEAVISEIPPFSEPRTYAIADTAEELEHWIEAAEQAGFVAIWPSMVDHTHPALAAWRWRWCSPPTCRSAIVRATCSTRQRRHIVARRAGRAVEAVARRPRHPEDRARCQGHGASVAALWHHPWAL